MKMRPLLLSLCTLLCACDDIRSHVMQGGGTSELCVHWSVLGSPRSCCDSRGGYWNPAFNRCDRWGPAGPR
jgi:hypothetical protein